MAQYFTDFSEYTVGQAPGDWTNRWGSFSQITVVDDAGNKLLRIETSGSNARRLVSWDEIDTDANRDSVETLRRFRPVSGTDCRSAVRASGNSGNETGYTLGPAQTNVRHGRYLSGAFSDIGTASFPISTGIFYWARDRINGSNLYSKVWSGTINDEPEQWNLESTNTDISQAGWVGLFTFDSNTTVEIDQFSVGTNGDTAPTEPVTPGGEDNLTANDIQATSQVSSPVIGQTHAITAVSVDSQSATSSPALGQSQSLAATDVQSTSELTQPALSIASTVDSLSADDISSASSVSTPALGQVHNLAANDANSISETGNPTLQQAHALTSVDVSSLSTVSSPALTEIAGQDALSANDVEATSTVTSPTLAQVHVLQPNNAQAQTKTSEPAIAQTHTLTANDVASTSQVSSPTLRDASQVLVTPIKNTKATVSQTEYKAAIIQPVYKAEAG